MSLAEFFQTDPREARAFGERPVPPNGELEEEPLVRENPTDEAGAWEGAGPDG
jgi:hypothetical protein